MGGGGGLVVNEKLKITSELTAVFIAWGDLECPKPDAKLSEITPEKGVGSGKAVI